MYPCIDTTARSVASNDRYSQLMLRRQHSGALRTRDATCDDRVRGRRQRRWPRHIHVRPTFWSERYISGQIRGQRRRLRHDHEEERAFKMHPALDYRVKRYTVKCARIGAVLRDNRDKCRRHSRACGSATISEMRRRSLSRRSIRRPGSLWHDISALTDPTTGLATACLAGWLLSRLDDSIVQSQYTETAALAATGGESVMSRRRVCVHSLKLIATFSSGKIESCLVTFESYAWSFRYSCTMTLNSVWQFDIKYIIYNINIK